MSVIVHLHGEINGRDVLRPAGEPRRILARAAANFQDFGEGNIRQQLPDGMAFKIPRKVENSLVSASPGVAGGLNIHNQISPLYGL